MRLWWVWAENTRAIFNYYYYFFCASPAPVSLRYLHFQSSALKPTFTAIFNVMRHQTSRSNLKHPGGEKGLLKTTELQFF